VREILDDDLYRKKYSKINMRKLISVLDKYRDDKIKEEKGGNSEIDELIKKIPKIKEKDCLFVMKKLKESLGIKS
jgi:hypothetical protein